MLMELIEDVRIWEYNSFLSICVIIIIELLIDDFFYYILNFIIETYASETKYNDHINAINEQWEYVF